MCGRQLKQHQDVKNEVQQVPIDETYRDHSSKKAYERQMTLLCMPIKRISNEIHVFGAITRVQNKGGVGLMSLYTFILKSVQGRCVVVSTSRRSRTRYKSLKSFSQRY